MNITADGLAASSTPIDLRIKKQEIRDLLDRLAFSDSQQRRHDLQLELERLVRDAGLYSPLPR